ncbi:hypothetical protein ACFB49_04540 [Sphingomonas sp. DBB INV C78]|uniref:hypothetical protein n=1 Tax=Sphingomonas sp. DBB INV C78 TaxID=3349434 RepID=UPI0036D23648
MPLLKYKRESAAKNIFLCTIALLGISTIGVFAILQDGRMPFPIRFLAHLIGPIGVIAAIMATGVFIIHFFHARTRLMRGDLLAFHATAHGVEIATPLNRAFHGWRDIEDIGIQTLRAHGNLHRSLLVYLRRPDEQTYLQWLFRSSKRSASLAALDASEGEVARWLDQALWLRQQAMSDTVTPSTSVPGGSPSAHRRPRQFGRKRS